MLPMGADRLERRGDHGRWSAQTHDGPDRDPAIRERTLIPRPRIRVVDMVVDRTDSTATGPHRRSRPCSTPRPDCGSFAADAMAAMDIAGLGRDLAGRPRRGRLRRRERPRGARRDPRRRRPRRPASPGRSRANGSRRRLGSRSRRRDRRIPIRAAGRHLVGRPSWRTSSTLLGTVSRRHGGPPSKPDASGSRRFGTTALDSGIGGHAWTVRSSHPPTNVDGSSTGRRSSADGDPDLDGEWKRWIWRTARPRGRRSTPTSIDHRCDETSRRTLVRENRSPNVWRRRAVGPTRVRRPDPAWAATGKVESTDRFRRDEPPRASTREVMAGPPVRWFVAGRRSGVDRGDSRWPAPLRASTPPSSGGRGSSR